MTYNILADTDSYKLSHFLQYPPGIRRLSAYISARKGETIFFGLQGLLADCLQRVTQDDVDEMRTLEAHGLPLNIEGFQRIVDVHGGSLPVRVEALPEGMLVPEGVPMVQVVNTDPQMAWLTTYLETAILRVWYPSTVATRAFQIRKLIRRYMERTSDEAAGAELFKLHDFGSRGVSTPATAALGGCAHLAVFRGTDTVQALIYARRRYHEAMAGFSIPAAEHSTITSWGEQNEAEAFRNMVRQFGKPGAIFAVVSDSYDLENAVRNIWGEALRDEVIASGATLVVRPDSGDPTVIPVETVKALAETFGFSVNSKGYRVLHPSVRVIQGDGINEGSISQILANLEAAGFSADNIAFGMGGQLLQYMSRDTYSFAMKANAIQEADGIWRDTFKSPATDPRKRSLAGRQAVILEDGRLTSVKLADLGSRLNLLQPVWESGEALRSETLGQIRERVEAALTGRALR
ncbi:nicotinate phosphoribosyltransferase [Chelatococcus asaccharovorans]|uniref:Nicotinamide phosphoribosyltransferase n=1 Tax=Chelatococcus asaccharovorans TaxID=28210 RepID=A0A2V3UBT9_9HYPH|nr:nicotinate phosphoribosyltransferase [Chelatococcus asaccharovorans]MBS7703344.1 nicotinate phosphoribosyltransferase [Chelatococcus asaccharovorans]PXW61681.1 nicotinamide phosphoribosyltransferase [Chelatococcus asaccharovorans]